LWSAGTLAYEIFGQGNPFSGQSTQGQLHNRTYADEELPSLPDEIPAPLRALVYEILARNPSKVTAFLFIQRMGDFFYVNFDLKLDKFQADNESLIENSFFYQWGKVQKNITLSSTDKFFRDCFEEKNAYKISYLANN